MSSTVSKQRTTVIGNADERLLAELGYKQEFRREFTALEVCYYHHLLTWRLPSAVAHVLPWNRRYSGFRSVSSDSFPLSRQSLSFLFSLKTYLIHCHLQFSPLLFRSQWRSGSDGLGGKSVSFSTSALVLKCLQWAIASIFIFVVGLSMAELASAAPTSGGVRNRSFATCHGTSRDSWHLQLYFWTHTYSSPKCRNLLAWIVGCKPYPFALNRNPSHSVS